MTRQQQKMYVRPATASGEIARSMLKLVWVLGTLPIKLAWVVVTSILGGMWGGYARNVPRFRSMK